ncbi:MAG: hypothetical protein K2X35_07390 [Bryobacteraceae bacterium]|nr:hypothetical protein [Bryobacteraceae bacterium]
MSFLSELWRLAGRSGMMRPGLVLVLNAVVIVTFGVWIPYTKGFDFLDVLFQLAYAMIGALFVAPAALALFAAPFRATSTREIHTKALAAAGFGWLASLLILSIGLIAVNQFHWIGRWVLPSLRVFLSAAAIGLSLAIAISYLAANLSLRFASGTAQALVRILFLLILGIVAFRERLLPEPWRDWISLQLTGEGLPGFASILGPALLTLALAFAAAIQVSFGKR